MLEAYDPSTHPVIGPLVKGGPAELVRGLRPAREDGYVDACHLCYEARRTLRERYPEALGPPTVYGLGDEENGKEIHNG